MISVFSVVDSLLILTSRPSRVTSWGLVRGEDKCEETVEDRRIDRENIVIIV